MHPRTGYKTTEQPPRWVHLCSSDPDFLLAALQSAVQTTEEKGNKMMRVYMNLLKHEDPSLQGVSSELNGKENKDGDDDDDDDDCDEDEH